MIKLRDLIAELSVAVEKIPLLIAGESGLVSSGVSVETAAEINLEIIKLNRRHELLNEAVSALVALDEDGYPETLDSFVTQKAIGEIHKRISEMVAAVGRFKERPKGILSFGKPIDK